MVRIHPFQALRPLPSHVVRVATLPYDVMDREEASAMAQGNPLSFLHVTRSEIDLVSTVDAYDASVYTEAKASLDRLVRDGVLMRESAPCFYVYRLRRGDHIQRGLVACFHVDDYDRDVIKKHEKTRKDKEDDRTRHIATVSAQTGPVFLTYRDQPAMDRLIQAVEATTPLYDFTAEDGIGHTIWIVSQTQPFVDAFRQVPTAYIADGHHRAASAVRTARDRRAANPAHNGTEEYNWFQAVIFPAGQLRILPYNRVVKDLNGRSAADFLAEVRRRFDVADTSETSPSAVGRISMYLEGRWYGLTVRPGKTDATDPVAALDVSFLQNELLAPLLGIQDPRTDKRIDFVGGIRGTGELVRRVDSKQAAVAFSMYPTTLEQLMAIADAGKIMPPKSTWFEPKLRDGLLVHTF